MKRWFPGLVMIPALLVFLTPGNPMAQKWDLRLWGGWSNSTFYGGSKMLGDGDRNGLALGASAEYVRQLGDEFGFEFGVAYVEKGSEGTVESNPVDPYSPDEPFKFEGETELAYLDLSFLAVAHIPTGKTSEVRAYLGPSLGNLLNAKAKGTFNGDPVDIDLKDELSTFDWTWTIGAGFTYDFEKVSVTIDARVLLGINSIADTDVLNADLKTRTFLVALGVELPLTSRE